jgi:hypothetical protein
LQYILSRLRVIRRLYVLTPATVRVMCIPPATMPVIRRVTLPVIRRVTLPVIRPVIQRA